MYFFHPVTPPGIVIQITRKPLALVSGVIFMQKSGIFVLLTIFPKKYRSNDKADELKFTWIYYLK